MSKAEEPAEYIDVGVRISGDDLARFRAYKERLRTERSSVAALSLIRAGLDAEKATNKPQARRKAG